jgi:hypothetical protein
MRSVNAGIARGALALDSPGPSSPGLLQAWHDPALVEPVAPVVQRRPPPVLSFPEIKPTPKQVRLRPWEA